LELRYQDFTIMQLRPYQLEIARAVMDSIQKGRGLIFSVEKGTLLHCRFYRHRHW